MMSAVNTFIQEEKDWLAPSKRFDKWGVNQGQFVNGEDDETPEGLTLNKNLPRKDEVDEDTE